MAEDIDLEALSVERVMESTGVDRQTVDRRLTELMVAIDRLKHPGHREDEEHKLVARADLKAVFLTLRNRVSGQLVRKRVALGKTVREVLMFDSLSLFPEVSGSLYRVHDYEVTLDRTGRFLGHSETLRYAGLRDNDTLEITSPRGLGDLLAAPLAE